MGPKMKKTFFAACCSVLLVGFSIAQEAPVQTPTPDVVPTAPVAQAAEVVEATAIPAAATPVQDSVVSDAATVITQQDDSLAPVQDNTIVMDGGLNQGIVIGAPVAQGQIIESGQYDMPLSYDGVGVVSQNFVDGNVMPENVIAPSVVPQTVFPQAVMSPQVIAPSVVPQTVLPQQSVVAPSVIQSAPVAYNAPATTVADPFSVPATTSACVNCGNNVSTGIARRGIVRSVATRGRSVFTRVRGVFGRRR